VAKGKAVTNTVIKPKGLAACKGGKIFFGGCRHCRQLQVKQG